MDGCFELNKVQAIYKPRKPPVEGEAEQPQKWARLAGPMDLGRPAYPLSGSPRSHLSRVDSSHFLEFMSFSIAPLWTLLSWRYLREKDRIGNPSLNLHLLCLIPKYLDLIFVGSVLWGSLGGWMCVNGLRINMGFGPPFWALALVFLRVSARSQASSFHALK